MTDTQLVPEWVCVLQEKGIRIPLSAGMAVLSPTEDPLRPFDEYRVIDTEGEGSALIIWDPLDRDVLRWIVPGNWRVHRLVPDNEGGVHDRVWQAIAIGDLKSPKHWVPNLEDDLTRNACLAVLGRRVGLPALYGGILWEHDEHDDLWFLVSAAQHGRAKGEFSHAKYTKLATHNPLLALARALKGSRE